MGREKIIISKNSLYRLYHLEKKSAYKIANIYACSFQTISNRLKEYKIPRKSKPQAQMRYAKYDFDGDPKEKAYLVGFRTGDLRVFKRCSSSETVVAQCHTTNNDQLILMKNLFKKYGKVTTTHLKDQSLDINCFLNTSFHFLLAKRSYIEPWIYRNKKILAAFMAGYIDAEGSFGVYQGRARFKTDSYDKNILFQLYLWLNKQAVRSKFFQVGKKGELRTAGYCFNQDLWRLNVNEAGSLVRFINIIKPFLRHRKRIKDMENVLGNIELRKQRGTIP